MISKYVCDIKLLIIMHSQVTINEFAPVFYFMRGIDFSDWKQNLNLSSILSLPTCT